MSIESAKYNKSNVMIIAWSLVKQLGYKITEALTIALTREKNRAMKAYSKLTSDEKAILNGNKTKTVATWVPTPEQEEGLHNYYHNSTKIYYR